MRPLVTLLLRESSSLTVGSVRVASCASISSRQRGSGAPPSSTNTSRQARPRRFLPGMIFVSYSTTGNSTYTIYTVPHTLHPTPQQRRSGNRAKSPFEQCGEISILTSCSKRKVPAQKRSKMETVRSPKKNACKFRPQR